MADVERELAAFISITNTSINPDAPLPEHEIPSDAEIVSQQQDETKVETKEKDSELNASEDEDDTLFDCDPNDIDPKWVNNLTINDVEFKRSCPDGRGQSEMWFRKQSWKHPIKVFVAIKVKRVSDIEVADGTVSYFCVHLLKCYDTM